MQIYAGNSPMRSHRLDMLSIWLPMASDGDRIDMVMACQIFADAPHGG